MTKAQLITDIRSKLNESTADFWSDAELLRWTNQRYHLLEEAVDRVFENYFLTESVADTVEDEQEYQLPTDFKRMRRVEINYDCDNDNSVYQRAFPIELDQIRQRLENDNLGIGLTRRPVYYLRGDNIGFLPIPDSAGSEALRIQYVAEQDDLSDDDDTPEIPMAYHYLIVVGACADAFEKGKRDLEEANRLNYRFDIKRKEMMEELEDRVIDESKYVIDASGDSLDFTP